MSNRLGGEPSAYLRQHADNPVDWWPYGPEAFEAAAERDVPVFVSIGYAACHWCHVMASESFEDPDVATYLNANFVSIKVDREERPDVDDVYMSATQALTGEGGWPLTVFTDLDGRAFYAGTYFPPQPVSGRPSFLQVLAAVSEAWSDRRSEIERTAQGLAESMGRAQALNRDLVGPIDLDAAVADDPATGSILRITALQAAVDHIAQSEDRVNGGFRGAPKFPSAPLLSFLVRYAATAEPGHEVAWDLIERTLSSMAFSALYDQVEGGFARYSVTADWSLPHFEKMLSDNAQLMQIYLQASRLGARDRHEGYLGARIAAQTGEWMIRELGLAGGGFASSLDADTVIDGEHYEGLTYVWTPEQFEEVLGPQASEVATLMGVGAGQAPTEHGWPLHPGRVLTDEEQDAYDELRPTLQTARRSRPQPGQDAKVVAGWNAMTVSALADGAMSLDRPDFLEAAVAAGTYLWDVHTVRADDGAGADLALLRVSFDGEAADGEGQLSDYALTVSAFLALYASTGDTDWYARAERLLASTLERFVVDGALQDVSATAEDASALLSNAVAGQAPLDPLDDANPSGAASLAAACTTYAAYSGSTAHRVIAEQLIGYVGRISTQAPEVVGAGLAAATVLATGPVQVAIVGKPSPSRSSMRHIAAIDPSPSVVVALGSPGEESIVPLLQDRPAGPHGETVAYVCRDMVCDMPARTDAQLRKQLLER